MHIGLIGGIGPAATVVYYEHIVSAFALQNQSPSLTIAHTSAALLSKNVTNNNVAEQVAEYCRVSAQLAAAGAEVVVITSMGGHFCAKEFAHESPLPMINGPDSVALYLQQKGIQRVGIIGTRVVMQTKLYGSLTSMETLVPQGDDLVQVNDDYVAMAVAGKATPAQRQRLLAAGKDLCEQQGADVVLLGGTDLNLVYDSEQLDFPVIDSAIVHADAIVSAALSAAQ